jgi:predicted type IV restriction endonuclease
LPVTQEKARQDIASLIQKYKGMNDNAKRNITEAGVVHQFLDPFLRALGWPVDDPERYKYELFVAGGRPDMNEKMLVAILRPRRVIDHPIYSYRSGRHLLR